MNRMSATASKVASGDSDIAKDATDMKEAQTAVRANVAVVRATDKMMGTLLDMVG